MSAFVALICDLAVAQSRAILRAATRPTCPACGDVLVNAGGVIVCPACSIREGRCLFCSEELGRSVTVDERALGSPCCRACAKPAEELLARQFSSEPPSC